MRGLIFMEKRIISKESLSDLFAKDEIEAAELLRDALMEVKSRVGNITDPDIKKYNDIPDAGYRLDISLTTIKNYSAKYDFGIYNVSGENCVVKQFNVNDYREIKNKLDSIDVNKGEKNMDNKKLTAKEELAINYIKKAEDYKDQTQISIRVAESVQARLDNMYKQFPMLPKQYILSYLLDIGLTQIEGDINNEKND